jgi:hypothetical protein
MPEGWAAGLYKGHTYWVRRADPPGRRAVMVRDWLLGWCVTAYTPTGVRKQNYLETRRKCLAFVRDTEKCP